MGLQRSRCRRGKAQILRQLPGVTQRVRGMVEGAVHGVRARGPPLGKAGAARASRCHHHRPAFTKKTSYDYVRFGARRKEGGKEGGREGPSLFFSIHVFFSVLACLLHHDMYLRSFDDLYQSWGLVAATQRQPKVAHCLAGLLVHVDRLDGQNSGFGGVKNMQRSVNFSSSQVEIYYVLSLPCSSSESRSKALRRCVHRERKSGTEGARWQPLYRRCLKSAKASRSHLLPATVLFISASARRACVWVGHGWAT